MNRRLMLCLALGLLPVGQPRAQGRVDTAVAPTRSMAVRKAGSQTQTELNLPVRTYALHRLTTQSASSLLGPYVQGDGGGVYEGANQHEITVRAYYPVLARVDSILREEDKPARTIVLRFQLIIASDSAFRDPATADVDAALRDLFRFKGYRLLAQGSLIASEYKNFDLTIGNLGSEFNISGQASGVSDKSMLPLEIALDPISSAGMPTQMPVLRTGVSVPLGQTVVLGSAARSREEGAFILTVRPDLQGKP